MPRKRLFLVLATLLSLAAADPPPASRAAAGGNDSPPRYAMEVTGARQVVGVWRTEVHTVESPTKEWMLFFPVPVVHSRQKEVKLTMEPEGELLKEQSRAQRPILSLRIQEKDGKPVPQSVTVSLRYEATLLSRRLVSVRPGDRVPLVPPMGERENAVALAATPTLDFRAVAFESWLDNKKLRRGKTEGEVEFARRVFSAVADTYRYKEGVPIQSVSLLCELTELDCDTLSLVFAAAMRANDVPSRVMFGWPARTMKPDAKGIISGHAQAEFFAAGVGWVPVEPAGACVARMNKKDPMRYFGEDDGTLLVTQVDPDYVVRNPIGLYRVDSMHPGPSCWSRGDKKPDVRFKPQIWEAQMKTVSIPRGK